MALWLWRREGTLGGIVGRGLKGQRVSPCLLSASGPHLTSPPESVHCPMVGRVGTGLPDYGCHLACAGHGVGEEAGKTQYRLTPHPHPTNLPGVLCATTHPPGALPKVGSVTLHAWGLLWGPKIPPSQSLGNTDADRVKLAPLCRSLGNLAALLRGLRHPGTPCCIYT